MNYLPSVIIMIIGFLLAINGITVKTWQFYILITLIVFYGLAMQAAH